MNNSFLYSWRLPISRGVGQTIVQRQWVDTGLLEIYPDADADTNHKK